MLNFAFSGTEVLLGGGLLVLLVLGIIVGARRAFRHPRIQISKEDLRTKYAVVDVFRYRTTFLRLGLVCALAFTFLAFNWTQYDEGLLANAYDMEDLDDIIETVIPLTYDVPPPPPPPPPPPIIETVDDDLLVDTTSFSSMDAKANDQLFAPAVVAAPAKPAYIPPPPPIKTGPDYVVIAERMPIFGDCINEGSYEACKQCSDKAMLQYINKLVRYPAIARESNVQGTAVVRFLVEKDGSLSHIELVRDPGAGLGQEAERVVQMMAKEGPRWTAGKQHGRPVRVQFNLPVRFRLE